MIPTPYIPTWRNIRVFALGLIWCCLGGIGPAVYEVWDGLQYDHIDWKHVRIATIIGITPMAVGYWRKYKALVTPPEGQ